MCYGVPFVPETRVLHYAVRGGVSTLTVLHAVLKVADVDVTVSVGPTALTVYLAVLKGADVDVTVT